MKKVPNSHIKSHSEYLAIINENTLQSVKIKELEAQNKELARTAEIYRKALYGPKSEKIKAVDTSSSNQVKLFPTDLSERPTPTATTVAVEVTSYKRAKRKRYTDAQGNESHFPADLPREEIQVPAGETAPCKSCGKELIEIRREVTERLCTVPAKFYVKRFVRPVLGCKCGGCSPVNTPSPSGVLPKTVLDDSFIASFLTQKFAWHLPFYRQSQMLKELGIELDRDVLIDTANKVAELLAPIIGVMADEIRKAALVHIDETPCTVGMRGINGKTSYNKHSYFWPILAEGQVVFTHTGDRRHCNVIEILGRDFTGNLMADAYKAYIEYAKENPKVVLALCWDHARRKFFEIKDEEPLAQEALEMIGVIYRVEREIKEQIAENKLKPEEIPKYRRAHALDELNRIKKWCETVKDAPETLPKSKLSEACSYVINYWDGLTVYLDNGIIPISNIIIEQQIRNLKLGLKNWLFAASEAGAEAVAIYNSLVCTCKMNGINILDYFSDVLKRVRTEDPKSLTPLAWQRAQALKSAA